MASFRKLCLCIACLAAVAAFAGLVISRATVWQPAAVTTSAALAIGLGALPAGRAYQFTAWIVAAVVAALLYPAFFLHLGPIDLPFGHVREVDLRDKRIVLAIMQIVMFGMGTQMRLSDLALLGRMGYGVLIGVILQFTIMPIVGYGLAVAFGFPPEIAAGIVLIGSCSSGLASNVMSYLAKANLTLSITLTAVGTLTAPLTTPLWMKLLAGEMVPVNFVAMMLDIIKLVIVPIGAALLHDYLKGASGRGRHIVYAISVFGVAWLAVLPLGLENVATTHMSENARSAFGLIGFFFGAAIVGIVFNRLVAAFPALEAKMPIASMFGIIFFTAVTTAAGHDSLLVMGWKLLIVSILHNLVGLILGYSFSRLFGLDVNAARTIAFEVGFQNGGMASGLAGKMGMLATVGLAPAVFSPWQNFAGSILANHWRQHMPANDATTSAAESDYEDAPLNKSL
jgi:bile acid:Na+ symporter, BASS family